MESAAAFFGLPGWAVFPVVLVTRLSDHNHALCRMVVMMSVRHYCCADSRTGCSADDGTLAATEFFTHHGTNRAADTGSNSGFYSFPISREGSRNGSRQECRQGQDAGRAEWMRHVTESGTMGME